MSNSLPSKEWNDLPGWVDHLIGDGKRDNIIVPMSIALELQAFLRAAHERQPSASKERFAELLVRLEATAGEYARHQGAWEAEKLITARKAVMDVYSPHEPLPDTNPMGRDADWVLAIGHALGLDSGFNVPIVPRPELFRELFAEVRKRAAQPQESALLVALQGALGRLSMTMGNPAVQWSERSCIEAALVEEAIRRLSQPQDAVRQLVAQQAEDGGLWFTAQTAAEGYLQQALRQLHAAIEGEQIEFKRPAPPPVPERQPIPVTEIVAALEREAANTDTDPRWMAAQCLRHVAGWESRTFMCRVDTRPSTYSTATKSAGSP